MQLTHSQQLITIGQRLFPDSPLNNMAFALRWRKTIDVVAMQTAFKQLIQASESMRLRLSEQESPLDQFVVETDDFVLPIIDVEDEPAAQNWLDNRASSVLPLTGPLYDAALLKIDQTNYILYFNQHHLITDGWGKSIQIRYLLNAYAAICDGKTTTDSLAVFSDYVTTENTLRTSEATQKARAYWTELLSQLPEPAKLYGNGNPKLSSKASRIILSMGQKRMERLKAVCKEPGVVSWSEDLSRFNVFATVLFALMRRITGEGQLSIGAPAHNRLTPEHQQTPGLFIELFPLIAEIEATDTFASLLNKVSVNTMTFLRNARAGSSVSSLGKGFNVLLNFINQSVVSQHDPDFEATWLHNGHAEPAHHLKLQIFDFNQTGELQLSFDLNEAVFPPLLRQLTVDHFMELLDAFLEDRDQKIMAPTNGDLMRLSAQQPPIEDYPTDQSIVDLFNVSAERHNGMPAVTLDASAEVLTYGELNTRAEKLADYLHANGVGKEDLVAVCLDRSVAMMVSLLGILKAGAAYVPVDPNYPSGRRENILQEAEIRFAIVSEQYINHLDSVTLAGKIIIDQDWKKVMAASPRGMNTYPAPQDLMYVIYTSGSTGRPKGVMNQHDGLVNRLLWAQDTFQLEAGKDVVLQKTNFCFDVSVWELFWPLLVGCKLVFAKPGGHADNRYLETAINNNKVTTIHFVPPMLETFLEGRPDVPTLRQILSSGEALTAKQANDCQQYLPEVTLHNLYGPTEAAIDVTHWRVPQSEVEIKKVPIGKPVANTPLFILDESGILQPTGVAGELHIGGIQVARGYYNREDLTDQRFVALRIPTQQMPVRLYKTGDLARFLPDGNIEFLGRIDQQVKLRGFRIELGEIEALLAADTGIDQVTILLRKSELDAELVAYLKVNDQYVEQKAKDELERQLPAYMLPAHYVYLSEFPLTSNGKIDRKALLSQKINKQSGKGGAPEGDFEELVYESLTSVLQITSAGVLDNFFTLGMHSLSAIRLANRLTEAFDLNISPAAIFRFPTVRQLAAHLEATIRRLLAEMDDSE